MRKMWLRLALTAATVLATGACASAFDGTGGSSWRAEDILVTVENHNWADVTVYAVRSGTRARLGMVTSMNRAVFRLPRAMFPTDSDIRLLIDPIGSRDAHLTDPILVSPGQTIEMSVENNIRLTSWSVW